MSRATIAQLQLLGLDSNAINPLSTAQKQAALDSASARIDSAVANQYEGNIIEPYPLDIIECECVLASWTLLMVNGYNPQTQGTDSNIVVRFKQWDDYLDKVAKGELTPKIVTDAGDDSQGFGATGPSVITETQRGYSERGISPFAPPAPQVGPFSGD